jgi:hypothetical protein
MTVWVFEVSYEDVDQGDSYSSYSTEFGIVSLAGIELFRTAIGRHYYTEQAKEKEEDVMRSFAYKLQAALHPGPHLIR